MRKLLVLGSVIVLIALIGATTAGCTKGDEALVEDLIYRYTEAWNNNDYQAMYEMMSPNYRETASYEEFEEYIEAVAGLLLTTRGTTNYEVSDIEVRVEDGWAFASYQTVAEGGGTMLIIVGGKQIPRPTEDIYRKVEGKWYDVAESSFDPGLNEEDLPPSPQAGSETGIPGTRADLQLQNDVLAIIMPLEFSCTNPEVINIEVTENVTADGRWGERWTLDSCGVTVAYDIRFAPDGTGGTFFSVIKAPSTTTTPPPTDTTPVTFPDANLEAAIRGAINKPEGPIYTSDLEALTTLTAWKRGISDITGLEHCVNLEWLNLNSLNISDISPLASLTNLTYLQLGFNNISDISALAGLTNLQVLWLVGNNISDISVLAGLTNLEQLSIGGNNISDISALVENSGLSAGDRVYLSGNPLSATSVNVHIPQLEARGVTVIYE